uniref:Acetyltransferase ple2 n=1 Tax=Rhodocybe pseudopiperita TaxID=693819 RepID=PLE2_RHOPP|nr:RecName: Full=Acetyltransferase ple2; AltName: Full=Pleuromutilin biosynthesis cluster protein 2; Flags: Precursor [Rhodocybe pseudopiperita]BCI98770.1 putative acetyltransferase [Rhodocybe pseudopiperita]
MKPFSPELLVLSFILLVLSCAIRPAKGRWILWVIIVALNTYLTMTTTGDSTLDYDIANNLFVITLTATDYILLTDVQRELQFRNQKGVEQASLLERIKWATWLVQSRRGVGWNWEPKIFVHRFSPKTSRLSFLLQQLVTGARHYLICDLVSLYSRSPVAFAEPLASRPLIWRCADIAAWLLFTTNQVSILLTALSLMQVLSGYSEPQDWVPVFGRWRDAYTVRRFWGRSWHQLVRRCLSSPGKYLSTKVLGLKPGSNPALYVQLYAAFFLSGVLHAIGDFKVHEDWYKAGTMEFFCVQAVIIQMEDGVLWVGRKLGIKETWYWRALGHLWTVAWFVYSCPNWLGATISGRGKASMALESSLVLGLYRGEWHPPRVAQ